MVNACIEIKVNVFEEISITCYHWWL